MVKYTIYVYVSAKYIYKIIFWCKHKFAFKFTSHLIVHIVIFYL